ncbi:MAG: hypothetical protein FWH11_04550 [Micrococcales bacterium]|nr:hypothetical protein [Micrococcales bacterium]
MTEREPYVAVAGREVLDAIVAEAYERWDCPLPYELDVCLHCCVSESVLRRLRATPVREIGPSFLAEYYDSAHSSDWYGFAHRRTLHDEIKHFLPRHLEMISGYRPCGFDYEVALGGVDLRDPAWDKSDRDILSRWSVAFFEVCLAEYGYAPSVSNLDKGRYSDPDPPGVDSVLVMFMRRHFDLAPLLELWLRAGSLPSLLHFVEHPIMERPILADRRLTDAFYGNPEGAAVVEQWFRRPDVKAHFAERCLDVAATASAEFLEQTADCACCWSRRDQFENTFDLLTWDLEVLG